MLGKKLINNLSRTKWTLYRPDHVDAVCLEMNTNPENSICDEFYRDFHEALDNYEDEYLGIPLVLTSQWDNEVFSYGMDRSWLEILPDQGEEILRKLNSIFERLYLIETPTIAAVNGNAFAGGFILSLCCDFRFIDPDFTVLTRAPKIGLSYPSSVYHIVKYEIPFFKKFLLTGDKIIGDVAIRERISLKHNRNPLDDALDFIGNDVTSPEAFTKNKVSLKVSNYEHYRATEGDKIDETFIEMSKEENTRKLIEDFLERDQLNY